MLSDIIQKVKRMVKKEGNVEQLPTLVAIEGQADYRKPLPTYKISYRFMPIKDLLMPQSLTIISEELNVPTKTVREDILKITKGMIDGVSVCLEYPYVDEFYRDTYYSFYARKHSSYNRFCFRLSFFSSNVNESNYFSKDTPIDYYGYVVLRPTPRRIIGYTFLNPTIYKMKNYSTCLCERASFIKGQKMLTTAFPFSGQDGEMNTCAETCLTMMYEYFSRRYNKYSRILPSQVADQLTDSVVDRKQPSNGIDIDTISSIINTYGINTRLYYKANNEEESKEANKYIEKEFLRLLLIYIESGFPVYISTGTHAMLAIGRVNKFYFETPNIVVMNDSKKPYWQLDQLSTVESFVVPIPENILLNVDILDPVKDLGLLSKDYPSVGIEINDEDYFNRVFLTTSRAYKSYIVSSELNDINKEEIITISMPRFIWVCESIKKSDIKRDIKDTVLSNITIFDSTDYPSEYNHIIMHRTPSKLMIPMDDRTHMRKRSYKVIPSDERLVPFMNNLKGEHTSWKC